MDDVYDLTVEEDHNFVADGLVVHNSHSTGYAIIAYETAYLKTYFPNQYMAAVLTYESAARKVDDWVPYLEDCKATVFPDHTEDRPHVGVEVRPPDINLSEANFSVVFMPDETPDACRGHVRFGLDAIKGVSTSAINAIIEERRERGPFRSIFDFCERVDLRSVNKATIEALVKSGAFDATHSIEERSAAHATITDAISAGQAAADDRRSGQMNFFSGGDTAAPPEVSRALPSVQGHAGLFRLRPPPGSSRHAAASVSHARDPDRVGPAGQDTGEARRAARQRAAAGRRQGTTRRPEVGDRHARGQDRVPRRGHLQRGFRASPGPRHQ
jgi:hypothetical protein